MPFGPQCEYKTMDACIRVQMRRPKVTRLRARAMCEDTRRETEAECSKRSSSEMATGFSSTDAPTFLVAEDGSQYSSKADFIKAYKRRGMSHAQAVVASEGLRRVTSQERSPEMIISSQSPSTQPLTHESAEDAWTRLVAEKVALGMSRQKATMVVNRENPGLREQYIQEYNAVRGG